MIGMIETTTSNSMRVNPFASRVAGRDSSDALERQPPLSFTVATLRDLPPCMSCPCSPFTYQPPYETHSVNDWVVVPARFDAEIVNVCFPAVPCAGVPERTPVVEFNVTPLGKWPEVTLNVGAGYPVAVTWKLNE